MDVIVVTGASSGIGREFARQMDDYFTGVEEFWLIARDKKKLQETAKCMPNHRTRIFPMDITNGLNLDWLEAAMKEQGVVVRMLINCAGYGVMGEFAAQERSSQTGMVMLNCNALTDITHRMIPFMRRGSRIIQMASCAAFLPQPDFAVYAATKSYVLSFSRALGEELKTRGIYVTAVCPGPVDTPFFDIAERTGSTLSVKKITMVKADRVVAQALRDSLHKRPLSVCSLPIQGIQLMSKVLPHQWILCGMRLLQVVRKG